MILSRNPATGEEMKRYQPLSDDGLNTRLDQAVRAYSDWRRRSFAERGALFRALANLLDRRANDLGDLAAREMGKPIGQAVAEVRKCAVGARYFADHAEELLREEAVRTEARRSLVRYQPLGPILAVMPWNFPYWQVFRFAAPTLMAGNVALLKHASNVPQVALEIETLFREAGFPVAVFQTLLIESGRVEGVIRDPRIRGVSLTGSVGAGSSVGRVAGEAIKPVVLELGGSDPFIVLPDVDVPEVVRTAIYARTQNNGQSCIAAKRIIVHENIADEFTRLFVEGMAKLRVGDPRDPDTAVGPLAMPSLVEALDKQVQDSVRRGARILVGGRRLGERGNYYAPTVLTDIPRDSPAYHEELFGPVASLFRVADLDEAITLANDTVLGLGASVWTSDAAAQERLINELEAGMVFVNEIVKSDPRLPFGGIKASGLGRELSAQGIREFVNVKTVWIDEAEREQAVGQRPRAATPPTE